MDEVVLTGGNMTQVVRRGESVHRDAGPWTPTIHRLLDHLRAQGISWLPRPLGLDEQGREVLSYLPGTVPSYPMPSWVWKDAVLLDAGHRLAQLHQASAGFDTAEAVWQIPVHQPIEVICLNDVAPYNMVFDDQHQLLGLIDLDTASPGPRVWDLAYLAYRLVPLTCAEDTGIGLPDIVAQRERLRRLGRAYAAVGDEIDIEPRDLLQAAIDRLKDLAEFTARRAAAGAEHVAAHAEVYLTDAAWLGEHLDELCS
jgi:Ser/Thr protein kinase RdoA (MazF antagonist)